VSKKGSVNLCHLWLIFQSKTHYASPQNKIPAKIFQIPLLFIPQQLIFFLPALRSPQGEVGSTKMRISAPL